MTDKIDQLNDEDKSSKDWKPKILEMDMQNLYLFFEHHNQLTNEMYNLKKDLRQMTLNFATLSEIVCDSDDAYWIQSEYEKRFEEVSR